MIGNVHVDIASKPGPSTVLIPYKEDHLAKCYITMSDMGFGLSRDDVMHTVFTIANKSGRSHFSQNRLDGRDWLDTFCSRYPCLHRLSHTLELLLAQRRCLILWANELSYVQS